MNALLALLMAAAAVQPAQVGAEAAPPEARRVLHDYAACIVRNSRGQVAATLRRDFTTNSYRNALIALGRNNNRNCYDRSQTLRATGLPFAGALAEHMLAAEATPLNVRLAHAASLPPVPNFSSTDRMALCVVRSMPDEIARLLGTTVASPEEASALQALEVPTRACSSGGPRLEIAPAGLRAMFATAAYRTLADRTGSSQGGSAANGTIMAPDSGPVSETAA